MQQPLFEHRLTLGGYSTRALELEGDGPPVLLLHGYADSADTWRRALDLLARRGRRALALDLPGFGTATPLRRDRPVLEQHGRFARAAVEHVAAEHGPVLLCGNSLGGCVALRAAQDPELPVLGVVPVAPAGFDMPAWFRIIEGDRLLRTLLAVPVGPVPELVVRRIVGQVYRNLAFARPGDVPAEIVRAFTAHHRSRSAVLGHLATGRRLLPELKGCFDLAQIRAPVLLVWGERDRMVTHRGARHLVEALPGTTFALLEGVGHCPQVEAPERFVELLEDFTATLATGRRGVGAPLP
jgi:pimeloyl-ACP methyl ester carboxylesterase